MSSTNSIEEDFSCPKCGSSYTQSIAVAYSRSVRSSDSGYDSISAFGKTLAPPQQRDEKMGSTLVACLTALACLILLPELFGRLDIPLLSNLTAFSWPVILGSCVTGWAAGLIVAYPAIHYNVRDWPREYAKWEAQVVCNRCSNTWLRSSPKNRSGHRSSP
jgi:hypothetical protein